MAPQFIKTSGAWTTSNCTLLLWLGAVLASFSDTPISASETPPPQQVLFAADSPAAIAAEAANWSLPAGATHACAPVLTATGLEFRLPRLSGPAVQRAIKNPAGAPDDWSIFPALQVVCTAPDGGTLGVILTDATGKSWRYPLALKAKAEEQNAQIPLAEAAKSIDLKQVSLLAIGFEAPPDTPAATALAVTFRSLTLGPLESESAAEIKSTWYYGFLSNYGYLAFFVVLLAISLGIPLPEEIFLLTAGYLAHLTITEPEIGINVHIITIVCFTGILGGDLFIYSLGRYKGERVRQWRWFKRLLPETAFVRVRRWFDRFGVGATAAFRFIPPIRMPGFFAAGLLKQSPLKFILADGIACLVSIPTQIYLVYYYGDYVIPYVKKFNVVLIGALIVGVIAYVIWELMHRKKAAAEPVPAAVQEANQHSPIGVAALEGADVEHLHATHSKKDGSKEEHKPDVPPPGN